MTASVHGVPHVDVPTTIPDPNSFFVADPLPPCPPLTQEERAAILDNYRWFSKFPPVQKLRIAYGQRQMALYLQRLSRGVR